MASTNKTFFDFRNDRHLYFFLSIAYTFFLVINYFLFQSKIGDFLDRTILFYFDGSRSKFMQWYPKFGFWVFLFFYFLKYSFIFFLSYVIYKGLKRIEIEYNRKNDDEEFYFKRYIFRQIKINVICLVYFVCLYYLFIITNKNYSENFQVLIARGYLLVLIVQVIFNSIRHRGILNVYLKDYLFLPQLPFNISILRIIFFSCLIVIYVIIYNSMLPVISLKAKVSLPFIGWLINAIPVNVEIYTFFFYLGVLSCIFIVVGFKTRYFLLLNAICVFYIIATPNFFGKLWHIQLIIWIAWIFTFAKCYDVFSIDAKINNTPVVRSANYTFPIRFVWIQLGVIYFWAGFYKLWDAGFDWALSQSMINQVQLEWVQNYDKVPGIRIDHYPLLLYACGLMVILFELTYFLFVLRPKLRWISALGGFLMHSAIWKFMYISFFYFLQIFYVFYFDFNQLFKRVKANIKVGYSKKALYSGLCILSCNFFFGMFHIDSYPFSSYPAYSVIIPDKVKIIEFHCDKLNSTVHEIGKKNGFAWENYGWLENNLIADFESGQNVQKRLEDYWTIWAKMNPQLQICDTVFVNLIERPVSPEGWNKNIFIKRIGTIRLKK